MDPIFVTYGYRIDAKVMLDRLRLEAGTGEAEDLLALAGRMHQVAEACLEGGEDGPGAAYTRIPVEYVGGGGRVVLGGVTFLSPLLARRLLGAEWVYPHVATCGPGLAAWFEEVVNPLERYWADEILRCMLDGIGEAVKADIGARFGEIGLVFAGPGSFSGWGLEGHSGVFALVGSGAADLGVVLRDDLLMQPLKSLSGILHPGRDGGDAGGCPGGGCPRAGQRCPGKRPGCAGGGCGSCCGGR